MGTGLKNLELFAFQSSTTISSDLVASSCGNGGYEINGLPFGIHMQDALCIAKFCMGTIIPSTTKMEFTQKSVYLCPAACRSLRENAFDDIQYSLIDQHPPWRHRLRQTSFNIVAFIR